MPKIFISYRRQDSAYAAGIVRDHLQKTFGRESVFMDIDNVPLGQDFREHIQRAVNQCDVFLALIGENWTGRSDTTNRTTIDDPQDYVRVEVEAALLRSIPLIPVLVGQGRLPNIEDLPSKIQLLSFRNAAELRPGPHLQAQLKRLSDGIEESLRSSGLLTETDHFSRLEARLETLIDNAIDAAKSSSFYRKHKNIVDTAIALLIAFIVLVLISHWR
jgi:hypothetical protein